MMTSSYRTCENVGYYARCRPELPQPDRTGLPRPPRPAGVAACPVPPPPAAPGAPALPGMPVAPACPHQDAVAELV